MADTPERQGAAVPQTLRRDAGAPRHSGTILTNAESLGLATLFLLLLGFMAPWIRADLNISRAQLGLIMSSFFLSAGIGSVATGRLADRLGARGATGGGLATCSLAVAIGTYLGTPVGLGIAAAAAGLGYASVNSGTSVAIAVAVPASLRTMAVSVRFAGVCVASTVAGLASPYLARSAGWHPVMYAYCVLTFVAALQALLLLPARRPPTANTAVRSPDRALVWLAVGIFVFIAGANPLLTWSVSFLVEGMSTSALTAGLVSAVSTAVGGIVMIVVSGWQLRSGRWSAAAMLPVAVTVCLGALLLLAWSSRATIVPVAVAGLILGVATNFLVVSLAIAAVIDRDPQTAGRSTGVITTGQFLGASIAPTAYGVVVDVAGGRYPWAWAMNAVLILLSAAILWRWSTTSNPS